MLSSSEPVMMLLTSMRWIIALTLLATAHATALSITSEATAKVGSAIKFQWFSPQVSPSS